MHHINQTLIDHEKNVLRNRPTTLELILLGIYGLVFGVTLCIIYFSAYRKQSLKRLDG